MTDSIMQNYNQLREQVINGDRRFQHKDGHLCFEGVDLDALARQYPTPFYVFSEPEIIRNIHEIQQAFAAHKNTKTFFASKTCSVMGVLKAIRDAGICAEANSQYEVRKCTEIGFRGDQIVFNGVVKKPADLEYAIANDLYLINVDSLYELEHIDAISRKLKKVANVCVRVEPNVPSATHAELVTAFHAKSGLDRNRRKKPAAAFWRCLMCICAACICMWAIRCRSQSLSQKRLKCWWMNPVARKRCLVLNLI